MVDGRPLNSYGPYMNDGLDFKEANATLVFGNDGKIYVETITTVPRMLNYYYHMGHSTGLTHLIGVIFRRAQRPQYFSITNVTLLRFQDQLSATSPKTVPPVHNPQTLLYQIV